MPTAEYLRKWQANLRLAVLTFLGGKCVRCGFDDPRALQIDHVLNDASEDRNNGDPSARPGRPAYYKKVMADTTGRYQLLCANCNWIKRYEHYAAKY